MNRSVLRLAVAQALAGANSTVVYATGAIIGHGLAPTPVLATLPISIFVTGMAASTLPVGVVARRHGRLAAFMVGNLCGAIAGLIAAWALVVQSFVLFCTAMVFAGAYAAVVLTFRFAAADCVGPSERPRALSLVLAGGVAAGIFGPRLVNATMDLWPPHAYAVTYIAAAAVAVISAIVLIGVRFEARPAPATPVAARPLSAFLRQPAFLVAMLSGVVSYTLMNFLMTSAPLAMELCGIPRTQANHGIELHVIAMYAPSFFTGRLIARFGAPAVILAGLAGIALAAIAGMSGLDVAHFWVSLILLGVGWNFGFLGASALVLTCHTPEEGPRVQAFNDFVVFGAMVLGSFASGGLLTSLGWIPLAALTLPPVLIAAAGVVWLQRRRVSTHR